MSSSSMSRRDGGAYRRAGLTVALAFAALAAFPAVASAGSVTKSGSTITFLGDGSTNTLTVTESGGNFVFTDTSVNPTNGGGCNAPSGNTLTCSASGVTSIVLDLGTGNTADAGNASGVTLVPVTFPGRDGVDTLTGGSQGDTIDGERKNDILSGGPGADTIAGGENNDTINGGNDNDTLIGDVDDDDLNGDAGNDRLDGGANGNDDDDFDGGSGIDRVVFGIITGHTYTCTAQVVSLDMDNVADDSSCADSGSDNNNVRDSVESVTGSTLGDTITGSCFANTIVGDPNSTNGAAGGNDTINGDLNTCASGNGADFLGGAEGNDSFNGDGTTGAAGFDTVTYGLPFTGGGGISVDLDDVADDNDGFGNTGDNVTGDIERVIGNSGADTINATAADQGVFLFGRLGNDTLTDSTFGDFLNGEGGADTINCTNGGTDTNVPDGADTVNGSCEF
jgi:hypothetical protein